MSTHDSGDEREPAEATVARLLREADLGTEWPDGVKLRRNQLLFGKESTPTGSNLTPERRARIADRLDEVLDARRLEHGPLPALLLFQRQEAGLSREAVVASSESDDTAVAADHLRAFETGEVSAREIPMDELASWVRAVRIDDDVAVRTMRQALLMDMPLSLAAGAPPGGEVVLSDGDERLLRRFEDQLQRYKAGR